MKIAIFVDCYYPRVNGVVISVKSFSEELIKKGHKIFIICPDYAGDKNKLKYIVSGCYYDAETKHDPRISVLRIPSQKIVWSKEDRLGLLAEWHKIKKELDSFEPDIIHLNSEFAMGLLGLNYSIHRKIPIAFTFHTLWEEYFAGYGNLLPTSTLKSAGKNFVKFYLKRVDEIIVPTERIGKVVERYEIKNDYDILPTGISSDVCLVDKFKFAAYKKKLFLLYPQLKKKKILLYVGRVAKEKNIEFLIDSFKFINEKEKDTVLLIVGGGPELEYLQHYAADKPYANSIIFTGMKTRSELCYFYHLGNVFVFASCTETQGLVTVEAMMSGLPVVAIGEMGTVDVMQGDNGGFMVKNDINDFVEKTLLLLNDKKLHLKKSKEAIEWSQKWDMDHLTDKLVEYYNKAIDKRKRRV